MLASIDDTLDTAFDIFYEMAEDNLEFDDLLVYQAAFDEKGAGVSLIPSQDWEQFVGFNVDPERFLEVQIGIAEDETLTTIFARMLLSRSAEDKFCHVLWKRVNH